MAARRPAAKKASKRRGVAKRLSTEVTRPARLPVAQPTRDPGTLVPWREEGETPELTNARSAMMPAFNAVATMRMFRPDGSNLDITAMAANLLRQVGSINDDDTERAEEMLFAQALTLDGLFNVLAQRAAMNMTKYPEAFELYMRLALKAQSQSRATLETLSAVKNPPVQFVRQQNIANGPQQVNNNESARGMKGQRARNQLLEGQQQ